MVRGRNRRGQLRAIKAKARGIAKGQGFSIRKNQKVHLTEKYARLRLEDPKKFSKLRVLDVGKPEGTKLIIGRKHGKKITEKQAVLLNRKDYSLNS